MSYRTIAFPSVTGVADVTGDGLYDLYTVRPDGKVLVSYFSADGAFRQTLFNAIGPGTPPPPLTFMGFGEPYLADLNADGVLDAIEFVQGDTYYPAQNTMGIRISVSLGAADGSFQPAVLGPETPEGAYTGLVAPAVYDVDHDGRADVVVNPFHGDIFTFFGAGDGTFASAVVASSMPSNIWNYENILADVNLDGVLDIVATPFESEGYLIFLGHADGTFSQTSTHTVASILRPLRAIGDIDGDGLPDLVGQGIVYPTFEPTTFLLATAPVPTADLTVTGTGFTDTLTAGSGADTLLGDNGADSLSGGGGNDSLSGGGGADTMAGGAGDDAYSVDTSGDVIIETAGSGTDTVYAAFSFTLGANLDNLTLSGVGASAGSGNALANVLRGNSGANALYGQGGADSLNGSGGNDTLDGGAGNDTLSGGAGSDTLRFIAYSGADRVTDFGAGDRVDLSGWPASSLGYSLGASGADAVITASSGDVIILVGAAGHLAATATGFVYL